VPAEGAHEQGVSEEDLHNLEGVLRQLERTASDVGDEGQVSVADVMSTLGARSFGPLLLVPGLIGVSPIGAIPGLPAVMALIVLIVAAQILIGMDHAWLPAALLRRSMEGKRLRQVCNAVAPYARFVDRLLRPRFDPLTRGPFLRIIAALVLIVALVTPVIELVPLAGIVPNAAIVAFGLALTAHDGIWALIATLITGGTFYLLLAAI
jgi:hypothetical protein